MKLFRASGLPIEIEDAEKIKQEFKTKFAELEQTHGPATQDNSHIFQDELQKVEDEQLSKYPRSREIVITDIPMLIEEFKTAIAITKAMVNNEEQVAAYIMDME